MQRRARGNADNFVSRTQITCFQTVKCIRGRWARNGDLHCRYDADFDSKPNPLLKSMYVLWQNDSHGVCVPDSDPVLRA